MSNLFVSVPQYYTQIDSRTAHADRMCFSSTVAMAVKFHKPKALLGPNADDDYLRTVLKYGDTTLWTSHREALKEYGLSCRFTQKASVGELERILREDRPVAVAWLHHGPVSAPRGGGHWSLLTGLTATHTRHHDPYGETNMVLGGYVSRSSWKGKDILYTRKNWLPRWQAGGEAWLLDVFDPQPKAQTPPKLAVSTTYDGSWSSVRDLAGENGAKWPQVVAAQWALESGYGKFPSGKFNFFGIKGTPGTTKETQEFVGGKWVTIQDTFKDYTSAEACIRDLIRLWYKDYKDFKGINRAETWPEACHLLRSEGYATDPDYPTKLITIIRQQENL